jgi:hypothetical protein
MHPTRLDLDRDFVVAIDSMEMRHAMLVVEHADGYPEEARYLRHRSFQPGTDSLKT